MSARRRSATPSCDAETWVEPATQLSDLLTFRLIRLAETISRGSSIVYKKRFGITNTELRVLVMLDSNEALSTGELSRYMRIDKAWVSRSVELMVGRKLLHKAAHPTDTRVSLISLTKEGRQLAKEVAPVAFARHQQLIDGLDRAEVEKLVAALEERVETLLTQSKHG